MSANPWKTLSSNKIYTNPWISLREDQVLRPDGTPGIYSVVEARVATGVIAIREDSKICLVGQYRYPTNCYSWEIPEGGAEINEEPLTAIQRELEEEAGLVAQEWNLLLKDIQLSNCYTNERAFLYTASNLSIVSAHPEVTEQLTIRWESLETIQSMIEDGEITDALTILGIFAYQRKGKK